MNGKVIGSSICVDTFPHINNSIYFLTQALFEAPLPSFVDRVYTSLHNSWILRTKFQLNPDKIVNLPVNQKLLIEDNLKKLNFYVTLIDANQKPGAVMFLFEGEDIGTILYAGKCCYSETNHFGLKNLVKNKKVDYMFVSDVCEKCNIHSKTKNEAAEEVINIIKRNLKKRVIIFEPCFREDILKSLLDKLKDPISVSENIMKHLEGVGRGSDFTLDTSSSKVIIMDQLCDRRSLVNTRRIEKIMLIPCPLKSYEEIDLKIQKLRRKGYHVVLYRNHCSQPELVRLVNEINPQHAVLLNPNAKKSCLNSRKVDLHYWSHIGNLLDIEKCFDYLHQVQEQKTKKKVVKEIELPPPVDFMADNESCCLMVSSKSSSEASPPNSFILVESDDGSIASVKT